MFVDLVFMAVRIGMCGVISERMHTVRGGSVPFVHRQTRCDLRVHGSKSNRWRQ